MTQILYVQLLSLDYLAFPLCPYIYTLIRSLIPKTRKYKPLRHLGLKPKTHK